MKNGSSKDKTAEMELRILSKIKETLEEGKPVRSIEFNDEDQKWVNQAQLLTSKKCYILLMLVKTKLVMKKTIK